MCNDARVAVSRPASEIPIIRSPVATVVERYTDVSDVGATTSTTSGSVAHRLLLNRRCAHSATRRGACDGMKRRLNSSTADVPAYVRYRLSVGQSSSSRSVAPNLLARSACRAEIEHIPKVIIPYVIIPLGHNPLGHNPPRS